MCFSPEADLAAAGVVGAVGIATLLRVRTRRELVVGALPLLFAAHQFTEAFVWLGLRGQISSGLGDAARDLYVVYAFAGLPLIVPVGFLLLEPVRRHRVWLRPFVAVGAFVAIFSLWHMVSTPIEATIHSRGIHYDIHIPHGYTVAVAYVIATCGPALLSSRLYLRWFGAVNLLAAGVAAAVHRIDFASVWCLYAALASLLILEHFRRQRALERRLGIRPTFRPIAS